jgi:hypothetical protein
MSILTDIIDFPGRSEKNYSRMPLKPELFEPLQEGGEEVQTRRGSRHSSTSSSSSLGSTSRQSATINKLQPVLPPHCPRPKVKAVAPPSVPQGTVLIAGSILFGYYSQICLKRSPRGPKIVAV